MNLDPALADMAARLAQLTITNASAMIYTRVQSATAGKIDQKTVNELRDLIDDLLAERNELVTIARAYEEQLVSQRMSDADINYIIRTLIPALRTIIGKTGTSDPEGAKKLEEGLDALAPLLSAEMLTVLQLIGFNYKKAIGEPLTLLVERLITSQFRADPQTAAETQKLAIQLDLAVLRIAEDEEMAERLKRVLAVWRAPLNTGKADAGTGEKN